eukprot:7388163-Prymnesium_polylepis.1
MSWRMASAAKSTGGPPDAWAKDSPTRWPSMYSRSETTTLTCESLILSKAYDRLTAPNGRISARTCTYGGPSSSISALISGRLQETPESYSSAKYVMRSAAIRPGEELRPRMALANTSVSRLTREKCG